VCFWAALAKADSSNYCYVEPLSGRPSLYVPFSGGKTSTLFITSFTNFASFGNRGKDSNRALQFGQCQRWRMTLSSKSSSYGVQ
jgi:hypothetical protein